LLCSREGFALAQPVILRNRPSAPAQLSPDLAARVVDQSTAVLMPEMYRLREENKLSKAEALRRAQVEFIHGRPATDKPGSQRAAPREVARSQTPFAHPYFWAPFILMGNWL
jgi:CHAT domain-containing protein